MRRVLRGVALCGVGISLTLMLGAQPPNPLRDLHFRFIGPVGNRADTVVGVPGDPLVAYYGAASGGIWKTVDGSVHFKPVFDGEDVSSVGALAIAPSATNIIWAGTGESSIIRQQTSPGDGVYKSTDAGKTWQHMGLEETGHIAEIVINPRNPDIVLVCALGQVYGPNKERGIYRTLDGGKTWQQVLDVNGLTGCSSLSMDARDPRTLFAGMWQLDIKPWDEDSGGPGSGIFVTHDGGDTWTRISGHGLPAAGADLGKIAVRVAPSDSNRVYALIEAKWSAFYSSEDGGATWRLIGRDNRLTGRAPYFTSFSVSPADEDLLYFAAGGVEVSRDGGETLAPLRVPAMTADCHYIWIDPDDSQRILIADDHSGEVTRDGGRTFMHVELPIAQVYHVYADSEVPYNVFVNRQDWHPGEYGPSRSLLFTPHYRGGIATADWRGFGGCESGFGIPDPVDPNIVWSGCYNGGIVRTDLRTGQVRNVEVWPEADYGWAPAQVRDRWNWTFPIAISPHNHNQVYVGSQYVYETVNGGQSWRRISPDLTLNVKSHEGDSGGVQFDNMFTFSSETLSAIAESPVQAGVIWVGSYDGQVSVTTDGGKNWANVTKNIPDLPPWGEITRIEPSHFAAGTAYVSDDLMMMGDYNPYIFKTTDFGRAWTSISGDIPRSEFSFVHVVREDPVRPGMLYAGTEGALYWTLDDGQHWMRLKNNLPTAPVYWITIQPVFNDLIVGTYGRGVWILDDITPLRSIDRVSQAAMPYLFRPRPAYRFRTSTTAPLNDPNGVVTGDNPPYGADINYFLPTAVEHAELVITGSSDRRIRQITVGAHGGLNRAWWDLRYAPPTPVRLLTSPPGAPWVRVGPQGSRPLIGWAGRSNGPRVAPGTYKVHLMVDGKEVGMQPLRVLADPHTVGTPQTMAAQVEFLLELRDEIRAVAGMINDIEGIRRQLENAEATVSTSGGPDTVVSAAESLEARYTELEGRLFDVHLTGAGGEEAFQHPIQLYGRLSALDTNVDFNGADLGPTDQELAVNQVLAKQLAACQTALTALDRVQGAEFNAMVRSRGLTLGVEFTPSPNGATSQDH